MLAGALANAYIAASPDDPAEVERIRAIAERALALAPDDASVLGHVGQALCFVGYPEEGEGFTARAVRKAPGSGLLHDFHGVARSMLNHAEDRLSHYSSATRLLPGWRLMWAVKVWQSGGYRELDAATEPGA